MSKPLTVAEAGRKGGRARTPKKRAAVLRNLEKANKALKKARLLTGAKRLA